MDVQKHTDKSQLFSLSLSGQPALKKKKTKPNSNKLLQQQHITNQKEFKLFHCSRMDKQSLEHTLRSSQYPKVILKKMRHRKNMKIVGMKRHSSK